MEYNEHARIHSPRAGTETKSFSLSFSRGFTLSLASFFFSVAAFEARASGLYQSF